MINFIQIGANVGNNANDIIWRLARENDCGGILVEPFPKTFGLLQENYADMENLFFENVAIMPYVGEVDLHHSQTFLNECQQASTSKGHFMANTATTRVPCTTLEALVDKYNLRDQPFELLQIDAERGDVAILLATNFDSILPKYIRYEMINTPLEQEHAAIDHLRSFGYQPIKDIYKDLYEGERGKYDQLVERKPYLHPEEKLPPLGPGKVEVKQSTPEENRLEDREKKKFLHMQKIRNRSALVDAFRDRNND